MAKYRSHKSSKRRRRRGQNAMLSLDKSIGNVHSSQETAEEEGFASQALLVTRAKITILFETNTFLKNLNPSTFWKNVTPISYKLATNLNFGQRLLWFAQYILDMSNKRALSEKWHFGGFQREISSNIILYHKRFVENGETWLVWSTFTFGEQWRKYEPSAQTFDKVWSVIGRCLFVCCKINLMESLKFTQKFRTFFIRHFTHPRFWVYIP